MISRASIDILRTRLKKASVRVFAERGHILLETAHVRPETLETISSWLEKHWSVRRTDARVATAGNSPCTQVLSTRVQALAARNRVSA